MKILFAALILILPSPLLAQDTVGVARIPKVQRNGFYRIKMAPALVSYLSLGFANARIKDQTGKEVPYLLSEETHNFSALAFREYKMDKRSVKGCCTHLILHNPERKKIDNVSLQIRNADTYKYASLLGSDDQKSWYALRESFAFYPVDGINQTSEMRAVDFPLSDYSFYKLSIDDSSSAPLNIIRAGYYETSTEVGRYSEIVGVQMKTEVNADKETLITLTMDTTALIDRITLELTGPAFYHRTATVLARRWQTDPRGKRTDYLEELESFTLNSRQEASVSLGSVRAQELLIKIRNDDNPPLNITGANLFQLNRYLVAYLEPSVEYNVQVGGKDQSAPVYDIAYFRDSIPDVPAQVVAGDLVLQAKTVANPSFTLFTNRNIIWVAIILVVALLGFMSRRLIREVSAKTK
jgi:hypothetical protein